MGVVVVSLKECRSKYCSNPNNKSLFSSRLLYSFFAQDLGLTTHDRALMENTFSGKEVVEVAVELLETYHGDVPQDVIEQVNAQLLAEGHTDENRKFLLSQDLRFWYDSQKGEVRNVVQLFRTFKIHRSSFGKLSQFCESPYANCITRFFVHYSENDEDYVDLTPFFKSRNFQNLQFISLREYPLTDEEEALFLAMLPHCPKLEEVRLLHMGAHRKFAEKAREICPNLKIVV